MKRSLDTKRLILLLLLLALTVAVTALIRVDCGFTRPVGKSEVPAGTYATLGDVCIYLSALLIGGSWAAVVSALGCAIADLCVGSYSYIIGTLIIKAGMALFLGKFAPLCDSWKKCFVVAAIAEGIMIVGYFLFDLLIFVEYRVAALEIPVNIAQGLVDGALGAVLLYYMPEKIRKHRGSEARRVH